MEVKIIRGSDQIGGSIVEISAGKTRIILDVGLELVSENQEIPNIPDLFARPGYDAVFITHYHGDHIGLAYKINSEIPIYIGKNAFEIVQSADGYKGKETFSPSGFLQSGRPIVIGKITVTPFLCDHSAFDSYMLLCEADGESVLYTGDFRANGRKSFEHLLHKLPKKVNKLICEGTTLSRPNYVSPTETELEQQAVDLFKSTAGPIFVYQSATNIDRIVTFYKAAKRCGRAFLQDVYMADVATAAGETIPNPAFSDVYAFLTHPKDHAGLMKYRSRWGKQQIAEHPFVMCVRGSMLNYLKNLSKIMSFEKGVLVYSMWSGYRARTSTKKFLDECLSMGLKIVPIHAGGHADFATIKRLVERVNPDEIIPIHTEEPEFLKQKF